MEILPQKASRELEVTNQMGIHARPAAMIVRIANKFGNTELWVKKGTEEVNGKSIMGLMMLAAGQGTKLTLTAEGDKAELLLNEIDELFKCRFEET